MMEHKEFCYWLQGHCELNPDTPPTQEQWKMIQDHLQLTFNKVTPSMDKILKELNEPFKPLIHTPYEVTCCSQEIC